MNEITGKNVMVTGGAGFIGSHLVDRLIQEKPNKIVVIDNLFLGQLENLEKAKKNFGNLTILIRDASIFSVVEEIIAKEEVQTVFDLATVPLPTSYVQPRWTYENNIRIVLNFCELLRQDKFDFYVHCSSSEAYGTAQFVPMTEDHPLNPTTTYGASKASQDLLIQAFDRMYDFNFFIFRPFNNFGERQNDQAYARARASDSNLFSNVTNKYSIQFCKKHGIPIDWKALSEQKGRDLFHIARHQLLSGNKEEAMKNFKRSFRLVPILGKFKSLGGMAASIIGLDLERMARSLGRPTER
jgi:nucleoside-diphosphate-sugar epimerase